MGRCRCCAGEVEGNGVVLQNLFEHELDFIRVDGCAGRRLLLSEGGKDFIPAFGQQLVDLFLMFLSDLAREAFLDSVVDIVLAGIEVCRQFFRCCGIAGLHELLDQLKLKSADTVPYDYEVILAEVEKEEYNEKGG